MPIENISAETVEILRQAVARSEPIFEESWQSDHRLVISLVDLRTLVIDGLLFPETLGRETGYRPTPLCLSTFNQAHDS